MQTFQIPRNLSDTVARADRGEVQRWAAALPSIVADLTRRWDLELLEPYQPGGTCSWVAPAQNSAGEDLVLKVGWRHFEAAHEADALRVWAGDGTARLYAAETFDQTSALLLERCTPGTSLAKTVSEPEQDVVITGVLRRLWREPPEGHPFRSLVTMCDEWAASFEAQLASATHGYDPGLMRAGMVLFRELPRTAESPVLLCTDLHAENVLAAQREPWLVVDPKPYLGDRTYDPLQHMLNCEERLRSDPMSFVQRLAGLLDLDATRLKCWLFARSVQGCLRWPFLYDVAVRLAP